MAKLKKDWNKTDETPVLTTIIDILSKHFDYSIADINSWDELTDSEKKIVSKEIWDEIVEE